MACPKDPMPVTPRIALALLLVTSPLAARAQADDGDTKDDEETSAAGEHPAVDPELGTHGWIALLSGAGLLAAGVVTGGLALHLNANLEGDCAGGLCPPSRQGDLETRDALARSSTVLISAGFVASMVGILILAVFAPGGETAGDLVASEARIRPAPRILVAPGTAALEFRF